MAEIKDRHRTLHRLGDANWWPPKELRKTKSCGASVEAKEKADSPCAAR